MGYLMTSKEERKKRLEEELQRILAILRDWGAERIILFGSLASGNVHMGSDLDLVVVARTSKPFLKRLEEVYQIVQPRVAVDILVYTPEEFVIWQESPFGKRVMQEGKVLYAQEKSPR
ncbi:MAG: nucleotidyltransferase domain-containing protein [Atribacterota bacterium]